MFFPGNIACLVVFTFRAKRICGSLDGFQASIELHGITMEAAAN